MIGSKQVELFVHTHTSSRFMGISLHIPVYRPKTEQLHHNAYNTSAKCGFNRLNTTVPKANNRMVTAQK